MVSLFLFQWMLILLTINSHESVSQEDRQTCMIGEDGTETCTPMVESDTIDYQEHILSLPRTYHCENIENTKQCEHWKRDGMCESDPGFMTLNCAKACGYCHLTDPKVRCQRHPNAKQAVQPNDINKMFERLLTDFPQYNPQILSKDPWLVVLDDVFTDEECDTLIEFGGRNFHRSRDAGAMTEEDDAQFEAIVTDVRTSSTDWCVENCWDHPVINAMAQKAENITMIPKENSEYFQVLRYDVGQYYREHHDFIPGHLDLPIGPRVYTFYIYLNDVEEGGGTGFRELNTIIEPKKGSVAIWPSVLNDDPFEKDERTVHEAFNVDKGVKYGANMWLHMYNFHGPFYLTCTG